ncbi:hypothetical protein KUCAC02_004713 [Chaenocephalus aceratus]|uniref:Uncharacterized protein n=1 Tax=Chaenocephalus aceratus TaxID=36190 RepID=A0ACB9WZL0_CHAAC|nr:hypothetical protein KUCAC02_004713 [Chaenocephalus aceratus]
MMPLRKEPVNACPTCQAQALMRPGRLDRIIYVPLPDAPTRQEIFCTPVPQHACSPNVSIEDLVTRTGKYSGAEVSQVSVD